MNPDLPDTPLRYAGFWRRTGATFIDSLLFVIVISLLMGPVILNAELLTGEGLLRTVAGFVLTIVLWRQCLGTPGKLLLDCQVVDADSFEPVSIRQAVLRYVSYLASALPLLLGFLWVARDKRKQAFHDKIANTVVLYKAGIEADDESQKSLEQLMGELR